MPEASLAYRKDRDRIWQGHPPAKYTRLLPHVRGRKALEIGAAEGVLSLLLARDHHVDEIVGLELRPERHAEALQLQEQWAALGYDVGACRFELGDIRDRLDLLDGVDTLIAVRSIYYLRDDAVKVIAAAAARGVEQVLLCGNKNRQAQFRRSPNSALGRFNRLAAVEGMKALLAVGGFPIIAVIDEGDPIVIGRR